MNLLSVVVVNWNAGATLEECLASVFGSKPWGGDVEVLLLDNASTDGSQTGAVERYPSVRLIQNARNEGYARAANQGLRAARGELVLLLNPDVALTPTAISLLVDFLATHSDAAVAAPALLNEDGSLEGSARRDPSAWTGLFGRSAPLSQLIPNNPLTRRELSALSHDSDEPLAVDWVSGACLMVRRAAFQAVGLMDERFFLFWEDADWCRRFRAAGWKVHYVPTATGSHAVGLSRAQRPFRSVIDFHQSAYRFYRKHHLHSAVHPMMLVLVGGLALSLALRMRQAWSHRR